MSYTALEETHLTYLRLMDSLNIPKGIHIRHVLDLSFNDFVTAKYLSERAKYERIVSITDMVESRYDNILPIKIDRNLPLTIRRMNSDFIISIGGTFRFKPIYDMIYAIHSSLNVGGKVLLATYPDIYDEQGRDVLEMLGIMSELPIKTKLSRWRSTLKNSIYNLFYSVKEDTIITDTSAVEINALYSSDNFGRFLFRGEEEKDKFFYKVDAEKKYFFSWNIIEAIRI